MHALLQVPGPDFARWEHFGPVCIAAIPCIANADIWFFEVLNGLRFNSVSTMNPNGLYTRFQLGGALSTWALGFHL